MGLMKVQQISKLDLDFLKSLARKIKQIKKVAKLLLQDLKNGLTPALKLIGSLEVGGCIKKIIIIVPFNEKTSFLTTFYDV